MPKRAAPFAKERKDVEIVAVLAVMCLGILLGAKVVPARWKGWNEGGQMVCTLALIFCMGVLLGRREGLVDQLASLGLGSLVLAVLPMAGSVALVWPLTRWLLKAEKRGKR